MSKSNPKTRTIPGFSFRSRLIWNNGLLVVITLAATTFFALNRTSQTNAFLTEQLTQSVTEKTEKEINAATTQHASELNGFFLSVTDDTTTLSRTIQSLFAKEAILNANPSWDARAALSALPQGSWDNPNDEPGSIFIPARPEIPDSIYLELNAIKQVDFIAPSLMEENPNIIAIYFGSRQGVTLYYPNIDLAAIVPPDFDITKRTWFTAAEPSQNPDGDFVWSEPYQDAALHGLVVTNSMPVSDSLGRFRGVVGIDVQLTSITKLVSSIHLGETGYAFLIDSKGRVIAMPDTGLSDFGLGREDVESENVPPSILSKVPLEVFQILDKMTTHQSGLRTIQLNGEEKYIAYRYIPSVGYSLGFVVPVSEMQAVLQTTMERSEEQARNTILQISGAALVILALSVLASLWLGTSLTSPLVSLTGTAGKLAEGDLSAESGIRSRDEIGLLAGTFNTMAGRLRETIGSLEQRVAERTADLEAATRQSRRRAQQFEAVAQVARAITSAQDPNTLLELVTLLVSQYFGFYHVGIFFLDERREYATLVAASSEGGKRMLAKGHRLRVGEVGIVGAVAESGTPRIALDTGQDSVYFDNPDLPATRSESALPLKAGDRVIGVLDVQSVEPSAFSTEDIAALSILADQVSIAIENARLYEATRKSLEQTETAYRQYLRGEWQRLIQEEGVAGYRFSAGASVPLQQLPELGEAAKVFEEGKILHLEGRQNNGNAELIVPIKLRGEVIGVLNISLPGRERWADDDIDIAEAVADRLALAVENARLFQVTTSRAERERVISEIASKIGVNIRMESLLRTAAQELSQALNGTDVLIQLQPDLREESQN